MPVQDELAAFIVGYCDAHADYDGVRVRRQLDSILTGRVLSGLEHKLAALFGFADEVGATRADGFDPRWTRPHTI